MATRSTPRLAPGAHLGAHRAFGLNDAVNNRGGERAADAPVHSADLGGAGGGSRGDAGEHGSTRFGDRFKTFAKPVWLSDMVVPERNSFGVLRLMMALAVLVSHAVFLATGQNTAEPLYRWTGYTLGQHGVQVFFFLSGILVAQSLMKSESVRDYAIARGLRIFPALIVCVLLTALVLGPWLTTLPVTDYLKDKLTAAYIVKNILLIRASAPLPGLFEGSPGDAAGAVNTSLWTLKYEVMCYVALALVGWIAIRTKAYREVAIVAIAGWLAIVMTQRVGLELGVPRTTFEVLLYFMIFFGAGSIAYALRQYIPVHGLILVALGIVFALAIGTRYAVPVMAVTLGYGALWLATFEFWGLRAFTNHSDYSYGTYIYGMPVSQALMHFLPGMSATALILLTAGIVLFLAFLSWEFIERPALRLRHRLNAPKRAPEEAAMPAAGVNEQPIFRKIVRQPVAALFPKVADVFGAKGNAAAAKDAVAAPEGVAEVVAIARPWRPMSAVARLHVASEGPFVDKAAVKAEPPPSPEVPKDRIAMALKRAKGGADAGQTAGQTAGKSTGKTVPITSLVKARIARKAVDSEAVSDAAPKRQFRPRPAWRPMQPLGPEAL